MDVLAVCSVPATVVSISATWRQKSLSRRAQKVGVSGLCAEAFPYKLHILLKSMIYGDL
jgi:hypothetical protein